MRGGLTVQCLVPLVPWPCLVPASPFSFCCCLVLCPSQFSSDFLHLAPFYWSTTENKVVTSDSLNFLFCFSMYISKRALRKHFDPRNYPHETYLLCELQWRGSHKFWRHWLRNDDSKDCHVEKYFLEEIFEPRSYNICDMTWYLSWSPCWECCDIIQDFLEEQPNVNINIRIARLYYTDRASNRRGLMELASSPGVTLEIMDAEGKVSHALWDWGGVSWWTLCMGELGMGLLLWCPVSTQLLWGRSHHHAVSESHISKRDV